ncbi:MAG: hypothetical protein M1444_03780 [Patescibacteria group bacterium]|nr:hypothetical protein [Patescibacteria group bacterium]
MKNKLIFGALAMDLKRVALGLNRGSDKIADKFLEEALKRRSEIDKKKLKPYLSKFLENIDNIKKEKNQKGAEDALLYSTIFQNASQA